jgi:uncharacterized membrane protein
LDASQKRVIAIAAYAVALVLFLIYFGRPFWDWATWRESQNSLDLGFIKVNVRPPFPSDGRSVGVGLVVPIVLAAFARVFQGSSRGSRPGE